MRDCQLSIARPWPSSFRQNSNLSVFPFGKHSRSAPRSHARVSHPCRISWQELVFCSILTMQAIWRWRSNDFGKAKIFGGTLSKRERRGFGSFRGKGRRGISVLCTDGRWVACSTRKTSISFLPPTLSEMAEGRREPRLAGACSALMAMPYARKQMKRELPLDNLPDCLAPLIRPSNGTPKRPVLATLPDIFFRSRRSPRPIPARSGPLRSNPLPLG